jgi:hypothetical protein
VLAQAGQLDKRIMTAGFVASSTDQVLTQNSEQLATFGALTGLEYLGPVDVEGLPPGAHAYLYKMICANGTVYEQLYIDVHGKIAGEQIRDTLATPSPVPASTDTPLETATLRP